MVRKMSKRLKGSGFGISQQYPPEILEKRKKTTTVDVPEKTKNYQLTRLTINCMSMVNYGRNRNPRRMILVKNQFRKILKYARGIFQRAYYVN